MNALADGLNNIENSPALAGMRALRQWVVYQLKPSEKRPGKTDKVPIDPDTRRPHNAHKRGNWLSVFEAVAKARNLGEGYGAGFVFTADCGFWFIDLDKCSLGDRWSDFAMEVCERFTGAAVEFSSSGTGLHLFGRGLVPPHDCKCGEHNAELYHEGRFAAVTGWGLQGQDSTDHSAALSWLVASHFAPTIAREFHVPNEGPRADWRGPADDSVLIERALAWVNKTPAALFGGLSPASFSELWTADVDALARSFGTQNATAPYDASRADYALASELAYWTGCDVERVDRLMRQSALAREKWEDRPTWLVDTILEACRNRSKVLQDPPTAADAWKSLERLTDQEILDRWAVLAAALPPEGAAYLKGMVQNRTGVGARPLQSALKQAEKVHVQAAQQRRLQKRAEDRTLIQVLPESRTEQARQVERLIVATARPGEYVSFGGLLGHVTTKALPHTQHFDSEDLPIPAVPQIEPLDTVSMLGRVERVAAFFEPLRDGTPKMIGVPDKLIEVLLGKKVHEAPRVNGLVTHPLVLPSGEILAADGLHDHTGLFLVGASINGVRPFSQDEAAFALHRLRELFLVDFEFASALDADAALAGLFTGVQRKLLDAAPGVAVLASTQSSGKTTIARRIHIMLTGRDMPVSVFPLGNEPEVMKVLLTLLLRNPAMVTFDNVSDGFTFRSGTMSAMMTAPSYEGRVLGVNKDAHVPTNVLFAVTGNNLSLGADEVTRWLVSRLAPGHVRPEERRFQFPDVVAHGTGIRAQVLFDVIGIVAGYLAAGAPNVAGAGTRFPAWDRMVRQPLVWAGGSDVAEVFRSNAMQSESIQARRVLVQSLRALFGDKPFTAAEVMAPTMAAHLTANYSALRWALDALGARVDSSKSVGHKLAALAGTPVESEGGVLRLKAADHRTGMNAYRVTADPAPRP